MLEVIEELNICSNKFGDFILVDCRSAGDNVIDLVARQCEVIMVFCTKLILDKLPQTFDQVEIRTIWRYVDKVNV